MTTTVAIRREAELRALFGIPETRRRRGLVVLGRPLSQPTRLRRAPVGAFTWIDRYEGVPLGRALTASRRPVAAARGRAGSRPGRAQMSAMAQNVLGEELQPCNYDPVTGFYRDGCCNTGAEDVGVHTVCTRVTAEFLAFSASVGNDLSTPHPEFGFGGLQPGDQWCLCAPRWQEAFEAGVAPPVVLASTHAATLEWVQLSDLVAHAV